MRGCSSGCEVPQFKQTVSDELLLDGLSCLQSSLRQSNLEEVVILDMLTLATFTIACHLSDKDTNILQKLIATHRLSTRCRSYNSCIIPSFSPSEGRGARARMIKRERP